MAPKNAPPLRVLMIGLGPHAKRIYLPLCREYEARGRMQLVGIVDLASQRDSIEKTLAEYNYSLDKTRRIYINEEQNGVTKIHPRTLEALNEVVRKDRIDAVIIASEPLTHLSYAHWALDNDLSILMDKPISTYENVSTDVNQASRYVKDFEELDKKYQEIRTRKRSCFLLMAQRRYHNSYNLIRAAIEEVFNATKCPVTFINTFHCDGQWRTPHEMTHQLYHSYFQGYGKGSHSGYHYFDLIPFILSAAVSREKNYDSMEVFSTFVRPADFLDQLSVTDHATSLNLDPNFKALHSENNCFYKAKMKNYGEMDLYSNISLKNKESVMTQISLNLLHNGVSQRNWGSSENRDLYKDVGRVAHETHIIEQGPYQCIQFHSYKGKTIGSDYGESKHLEVVIYRNNSILGGAAVTKFNIQDFFNYEEKATCISSPAKSKCFEEFVSYLDGTSNILTSEISSHRSAIILSQAIYLSAANRFHGKNGVINTPFKQLSSLPVSNNSAQLLRSKAMKTRYSAKDSNTTHAPNIWKAQ